jgi:hypothetical protein
MLLAMATFLHYNSFARMDFLGIVESFILQGNMAIWRLPIGRLQMVVLIWMWRTDWTLFALIGFDAVNCTL